MQKNYKRCYYLIAFMKQTNQKMIFHKNKNKNKNTNNIYIYILQTYNSYLVI